MTRAIRFHQYGDADVLKWQEVEVAKPKVGETRLKHTAVGLNFIDIYYRTGLYKAPELPSGLGIEAAGIIEEIGEGVTDFAVGDRVVYAGGALGSYSQARVIETNNLIKLPNSISDEEAAAIMTKGLTAQYLVRRTFPLQPGHVILFHAAAGGVGLIACQWAKALGATVIGTVGSEEKAQLAKAHGCDYVINYSRENFVERVKEITNAAGVDVVYDSIGKDTFMSSLDCLKPLGMMVSFGNASGAIPPFAPSILASKGSLFFTRPSMNTYIAKRSDLDRMAQELFEVIANKTVKVEISQRYDLQDAAQAHRDLENRKTTGSTILKV